MKDSDCRYGGNVSSAAAAGLDAVTTLETCRRGLAGSRYQVAVAGR